MFNILKKNKAIDNLLSRTALVVKICCVWGIFLKVNAQGKQIQTQQFYWLRYTNQLILSEKWRFITDIDNRRFMFPDKQLLTIARTSALYDLGESWSCGGGIAYFLQSPNTPDSNSNLKVPETRFHQDFVYRQSFKRIFLTHTYRVEERFIRKTQGEELAKGHRFNFRFRYRLQVDYLLLKGHNQKKILRLRAFDEIFFNGGNQIVQNVFDQNRVFLGFNYQFSPSIAIDTGYMNWFQQLSSGTDFYSRHIFRFFVVHTVDCRKNKNKK